MDRNPRTTPTTRASALRAETILGKAAGLAAVGALALVAGCSQPGPFMRRQTMMGALKSNVAQLESEKDQLTKQLAEQKAENRRVEAQLAEVDAQNGDLSARLDDARAVISRQGLDDGKTLAPTRSASDQDRAMPRRANPARSAPKSRKPPFTQIPSERRVLDGPDDRSLDDDRPSSRRDLDDLGPQSRLDDSSPWLPVARGSSRSVR